MDVLIQTQVAQLHVDEVVFTNEMGGSRAMSENTHYIGVTFRLEQFSNCSGFVVKILDRHLAKYANNFPGEMLQLGTGRQIVRGRILERHFCHKSGS